eukprot:gene9282-3991_t
MKACGAGCTAVSAATFFANVCTVALFLRHISATLRLHPKYRAAREA